MKWEEVREREKESWHAGVSVGNEGKREPRAWGVTVMIIIPILRLDFSQTKLNAKQLPRAFSNTYTQFLTPFLIFLSSQ